DDERLAERKRANRAARRLAHRRRPQQDASVARREQGPQPALLDVWLADDAARIEAESLEASGEVEARGLGADEQQPRTRVALAHLCERAEELRNALVLVQVPEAPDERRAVDRSRLDARDRPRRMRDAPQRPLVSALADSALDVVRMHDHAARAVEHLTRK